jgi:hypothetical protein
MGGNLPDQRSDRHCRRRRRPQGHPRDAAAPRWRGLNLPGALLATASLATLIFALSQASSAGWSSLQTLGLGSIALAGLATFVIVELHTDHPLLRIKRHADRGVGSGVLMMLAVSSALFGSFLLASLYTQNHLGTGAMATSLAFCHSPWRLLPVSTSPARS